MLKENLISIKMCENAPRSVFDHEMAIGFGSFRGIFKLSAKITRTIKSYNSKNFQLLLKSRINLKKVGKDKKRR